MHKNRTVSKMYMTLNYKNGYQNVYFNLRMHKNGTVSKIYMTLNCKNGYQNVYFS